jgi:hypothetical protein
MSSSPQVSSAGLVLFAILHHVSAALGLIFGAMVFIDGPRELWAVISWLFYIPHVVFVCLILYRGWQAVQDGGARSTPGKAVGFNFIPLFNFYWMFVAFYGLLQEFNRVLTARGRSDSKVSEGFGLTYCILVLVAGVLCFVPFPIAALPATAFEVVFIWQVIGAVKVLENG